jgi:cytochrome P450
MQPAIYGKATYTQLLWAFAKSPNPNPLMWGLVENLYNTAEVRFRDSKMILTADPPLINHALKSKLWDKPAFFAKFSSHLIGLENMINSQTNSIVYSVLKDEVHKFSNAGGLLRFEEQVRTILQESILGVVTAGGFIQDTAKLSKKIMAKISSTILFGTDQSEGIINLVDRYYALGSDLLNPVGQILFRGQKKKVYVFAQSLIESESQKKFDRDAPTNLLQVLLNVVQNPEIARMLKQNELSPHFILENVITFILAMYETSATAATFGFRELAKDPILAVTLRQEIAAQKGIVSYQTMRNMPMMNSFIKELLRFYTIAPKLFRQPIEDEVYEGWPIAAGTVVILLLDKMHKLPGPFPRPYTFKADRFYDGDTPSGYLPFGAGPRTCLAAVFAPVSLGMWTAETLKYNPVLVAGGDLAPKTTFTTSAPEGIQLKLTA